MFFYFNLYFYFFFCFLLPFPNFNFNHVHCRSVTVATTTSAGSVKAEEFSYPHEEGDEHVVNSIVCSKEDLPQDVMDEFDRCAYYIPMYRQLNLLIRCRQVIFNGTNYTANEMRKELCFNRTTEHEFHMCMVKINSTEGSSVPHATALQTTDFLHCMKETAMKRTGKITGAAVGCMVSVKDSIEPSVDSSAIDVKYELDKGKIGETMVPPV